MQVTPLIVVASFLVKKEKNPEKLGTFCKKKGSEFYMVHFVDEMLLKPK